MTNQEMFDLLDRFQRSTIHAMKLSRGDFSIELTKAPPAPAAVSGPAVSAPVQAVPVQPEAPAPQVEAPTVDAPLVGTFFGPRPGPAPLCGSGRPREAGPDRLSH